MKPEFLYRKYTFIVWNFHIWIWNLNFHIWNFHIFIFDILIVWKFHTINVYFLYKNSSFIFTYLHVIHALYVYACQEIFLNFQIFFIFSNFTCFSCIFWFIPNCHCIHIGSHGYVNRRKFAIGQCADCTLSNMCNCSTI